MDGEVLGVPSAMSSVEWNYKPGEEHVEQKREESWKEEGLEIACQNKVW